MKRDLIVIGASAGGLDALQQLVRTLPADFPASILIVLHSSPHTRSVVPQILSRAGKLKVSHPNDGEAFAHGHVYVAPPDFHMLIERNRLRVVKGPRENLHRPAIDPLFRSAAAANGPRAIGVVLSGMLDDGTSGLMMVRAAGGVALVQSPDTALFPDMPRNALKSVPDARIVDIANMGQLLITLTQEEVPEIAIQISETASIDNQKEARIASFDMAEIEDELRPGKSSTFACPDCGGVLWEIDQQGFIRYRCRVGHAYTLRHLAAQQQQALEAALWAALRGLEEKVSLLNRMAAHAEDRQSSVLARVYRARAEDKQAHAAAIRQLLLQSESQDQLLPQEEEDASSAAD